MANVAIRVFVYGTLKQGESNHARYCRGATAVEAAAVAGQLYDLSAGYPMLVVPESAILAHGTADALSDLRTQLGHDAKLLQTPPGNSHSAESPPLAGDWDWIEGEVVSFDEPMTAIARLDALEGYRPGDPGSYYLRVLVPLAGNGAGHAWTYVAPQGELPSGARRIGCHWP